MISQKYISPFIESQFPSFYKEQGPAFIEFMKAYYEWMEQVDDAWIGSTVLQSRSIMTNKDVDDTLPKFIKYFKNKYVRSLPENVLADKRLLIKHILDLYRTKGTPASFKLLFRIFFNEDIDIFVPNEHILAASDANWYVPQYIEVTTNQFLPDLIGRKIYTGSDATAVVESYVTKVVNGKTINVLYVSNLKGSIQYGEQIYCSDVPELNSNTAPYVVGSLSSISVEQGGYDYKIGDLLNVYGEGKNGIARVAATRAENGKVRFTLLDGGDGYSVDAVVSVTGGYGQGATFRVGDITNKEIYVLNTDYEKLFHYTEMENFYEGFTLGIDSTSGAFTDGETVTATAKSMHVYVDYVDVGNLDAGISNGEILSNTALGISGLTVYKSDENLLYLTGLEGDLTNANIALSTVLVSNDTESVVRIKSYFPPTDIVGSAKVWADESGPWIGPGVLSVYSDDPEFPLGYFVPGSIVTGETSGETAIITTVTRNTIWEGFPGAIENVNLDTKLQDALTWVTKILGRITYLNRINPGSGYSQNPDVEVIEPLVQDLAIPDGRGGYWGNNAVVTATAGNASGIVTAIKIVDSGLGYIRDENVLLMSNTNTSAVTGVTIVDQQGVNLGYWKDRKGFLSDTMNIIDSDYYQIFSYEIQVKKMIDTYEKFVKELVHPSGFKMFGKYVVKSEMDQEDSQPMLLSIDFN